MSRVIGIAVLITWSLFLLCDSVLQREYKQSIARRDRDFGEIYGPVSYFHPILKYGCCSLTLLLVIITWKKR